jgi:hypothetical protein
MDQSKGWGLSRFLALVAVLALHVAVLLLFLMNSQAPAVNESTDVAVQLLSLPRAIPVKIYPEIPRPRRLNADAPISLTPPVVDLTSLSPPPSASIADGSGRGVDWLAEKRRAVNAYEIRTHQPPTRDSLSGSPAEEHWWPRSRHHAGEQYKTNTGDWIVWITDGCYQVATAGPNPNVPGALLPLTVCPGDSGPPRSDLFNQSAAVKGEAATN